MTCGIFKLTINDLNLPLVLSGGQCFRWKLRKDANTWFGVIENHCFNLQQDSETGHVNWKLLNGSPKAVKDKKRKVDVEELLYDYFQLNVPLIDLYDRWNQVDDNFSKVSSKFRGVRILRQNPFENLFSFICSSNNNIQRISKMVETLCTNYGNHLYTDDEFGEIYSFPQIDNLQNDHIEDNLRKLGFGYRAKYIANCAKKISSSNIKSSHWLYSLREKSYEEAHQELTKLPGVGAKVADCVCLMSLDKVNAIPVDTHVWQIATTKYLPHMKDENIDSK